MKQVVLALGSNLGDRHGYLNSAVLALSENMQILAKSKVYETTPSGFLDQGDFLNAAISAKTNLTPSELISLAKKIEFSLGRTSKPFKDAPREIDIDIIFFENETLNTPYLTLPHPRWMQRNFVITPLLDLVSENQFESEYFLPIKEFLSSRTRVEREYRIF